MRGSGASTWGKRVATNFTVAGFALLTWSALSADDGLLQSDDNTDTVDVARDSTSVALDADTAHEQLFVTDRYPSASQCAECHPNHFREWSVSQHAYAQISPVFNAMNGTVLKLTNGTSGDFCIRCHTPVGMALGEPVFGSNLDRHPVSREGVTCIACHRVNKSYGRINARFAMAPGDITQPMYGPTGDNTSIEQFIERGLASDNPDRPGRQIHRRTEPFFELTTAASCGMCHDVTLATGFREIEAFSEYKSSPAARRGVTCQDCHMGLDPGKYSGDPHSNYQWGPAARVGSEWTEPRKLTNHMMVGVDRSVVHPALFPHNLRAIQEENSDGDSSATGMATMRQWLEFNWEAGWGTDDFEDEVSDDQQFPARWDSIDDRYDAREIIDENLELLELAGAERVKLLRNGYLLGGTEIRRVNEREIRFAVQVRSGTDGHGVPTSLDAERPVWLHVVMRDSKGRVVLESGDLDPNGDLRDLFSAYVRNDELPLDNQLFNLQAKFITRNARGGEREQVLPVPYSLTPLPFVRPARTPTVLTGRPRSVRKHKMNIEPLGERWAEYALTGEHLFAGAPYTVDIELKSATAPINLVNEIKGVGFDYGMTPRQVADAIVATHVVIWDRDLLIEVPVTP